MSMLDEIIANVTMDGVAPLNKKAAKQIATIYAEAVAQDALKRAAEELPDDKLEYVDYYDFSAGVQSVAADYKQDVLNTPINLL